MVTSLSMLALACLPIAGFGAVWIGGRTATWMLGGGWTGPGFNINFLRILYRGGVEAAWPGTPAWLTWLMTGATVAAVVLPVLAALIWVQWRSTRPDDPLPSLAGHTDVAGLTAPGAAGRAIRLRPSLASTDGKRPEPHQTGVAIGRLRARPGQGSGRTLYASWEDVVLAVMAPRAGKTTALAVPAILDAPGPVVATSNKADLWATTATLRRARTGQRVWVFDPQQIAYAQRSWWWNPLRGVTTVEEAHRLAGHFVQEITNGRTDRDFWSSAAHDLLSGLLLAAGLSQRDLIEVYEWLNDPMLTTPVEILRANGHRAAAASLQGRMNGAPETRDGVYETARTAAQCLRDDAILQWVTPPAPEPTADPGFDELDITDFVTSRQTLYLLSKDGAGAAAPLVAALTDQIMRAATRAAERAGGRLDPPLVLVLDEAANVCRISDLPDLYSHLGSRGITPLTILQSYKQGVRVWGEHGMDTLWSASTVKIIGAGIDDARIADHISRLIGDRDVLLRTVTRGDGRTSESLSLRRQRILAPEDIRALPRGTAILLATGTKAAMIDLNPWYLRPDAEVVHDALSTALGNLTRRAGAGQQRNAG